jgi:hypothetical protein
MDAGTTKAPARPVGPAGVELDLGSVEMEVPDPQPDVVSVRIPRGEEKVARLTVGE